MRSRFYLASSIFALLALPQPTTSFSVQPSLIRKFHSTTSTLYQSSTGENEPDNINVQENQSEITQKSPDINPTSPKKSVDQPDPSNMSSKELMSAIGTSPRRIFLSIASSSAIALAADFGGVTGKILSVLPEDAVEATGLDTYYPRGEYKRFKGSEYGYTFVYPKEWVGDTAVELAKAQRRAKALDYTMKSGRKSTNTLPDAAFGPPGKLNSKGLSQSDTNVSVVASPLPPSFQSLESTLGTPEVAAETLLRVSLAPEGSGRKATLLSACEEARGISTLYQFDYLVDRGDKGVPLRAISAIAVRKGGVMSSGVVNTSSTLVTFTVVAPQKDWDEDKNYANKLRKMADSFKLN